MNDPKQWRRHARAILNLYGQPLPGSERLHPRGRGLWDRVQAFKVKYVVDNNVPWEQWARDPSNKETVFILGTSALNERDQQATLYEDRNRIVKRFKNVYTLGAENLEMDSTGRISRGHLCLSVLDAAASSVCSWAKMKTLGDMNHPQGFKYPREENLAETARLDALTARGVDALRTEVDEGIPNCYRDYRKSVEIALICSAWLLVTTPKARQTLNKKGSLNSFLDAGIIKDALFLKAGVLSRDKLVQKMAVICGIQVKADLPKNLSK